jgi:hypothetical protein
MARSKRPTRRAATLNELKADDAFQRIIKELFDLLADRGYASKDEVIKTAKATVLGHTLDWGKTIRHAVKEKDGLLIIALTFRAFLPPRSKQHSNSPGLYIAPNYAQAMGFASVGKFAQLGPKEREICETKYSQKQILAARHHANAEAFGKVIEDNPMPALRALE